MALARLFSGTPRSSDRKGCAASQSPFQLGRPRSQLEGDCGFGSWAYDMQQTRTRLECRSSMNHVPVPSSLGFVIGGSVMFQLAGFCCSFCADHAGLGSDPGPCTPRNRVPLMRRTSAVSSCDADGNSQEQMGWAQWGGCCTGASKIRLV